jgi:hypothetical protein
MNMRPWLAGGACAAALTLIASSAAVASTTAVHHAAARAVAPGTVRVKGLHLVKGVSLPRTTLPHVRHVKNTLYSTNWSGYTAIGLKNVQVRFVSGNFNVPSVNCANSPTGTSGQAAVSHWVGLDGLGSVPDGTSTTVEQVGVTGYCTSGSTTPTYYAWNEMYPNPPTTYAGIGPGDAINVSVYYNSGTKEYDLVLTDLTTDSGFSQPETCPAGSTCLNSSAEAISEVPESSAGTVDLADYGAENFTGVDVTSRSGVKGNLSTSKLWTSQELIMVDTSGDLMAEPSALEGGQAFSTTWYSGT